MEKPIENKLQKTDFASQKEFVEELKVEWKLMWSERFDDKPKGEGVSVANYDSLGVERGTIIHATRDFKALNFREILEGHKVTHPDRFIQPAPSVGGWNKFIKTKITNTPNKNMQIAVNTNAKKSAGQQHKGNGRGWLHTA